MRPFQTPRGGAGVRKVDPPPQTHTHSVLKFVLCPSGLHYDLLTEGSLFRDLGVISLIIVGAPIIDLRRGALIFYAMVQKKLSFSPFPQFCQCHCTCRPTLHDCKR
jgi:hypothetical protein